MHHDVAHHCFEIDNRVSTDQQLKFLLVESNISFVAKEHLNICCYQPGLLFVYANRYNGLF